MAENDRNKTGNPVLRVKAPHSRVTGIAIVEKPDQIGGVFEHVRSDDPVVNVAPADELGVRPAIPNEIDLLDVVDVGPVRPIFFDQRLLVTMVEDVNAEAPFFRCNRCAARTNLETQTVALDVREDNLFPSHVIRTR